MTGHGLDRPFHELLDGIAPAAAVPGAEGLPAAVGGRDRVPVHDHDLQAELQRLAGSCRSRGAGLHHRRRRQSDFTNLFQPPDFSGVNGDNPIEDVCDVFIALVEWIVKEIARRDQAGRRPDQDGPQPAAPTRLRLGLYELAMKIWDVVMKTHDVMAHTGILIPHSEQRYENGELRLPNEIDLPLITLGGTIDGMFQQALSDAIDPLGHLDGNLGVVVSHSVRDPHMPYYPVLQYHADDSRPDDWEYHRPWAYPAISEFEDNGQNSEVPTPTETYDPSKSDPTGPPGAYRADASRPLSGGHHAGPGVLPDGRRVRAPRGELAYEIGPDAVADRPAQRGVHREGAGHGEPARRPGAVLRVPDRPTGQPDRLRDAVQPRRGPSLRVPDVGLDPRRTSRRRPAMGIKYPRPVVPPEGDDGGPERYPTWDLGFADAAATTSTRRRPGDHRGAAAAGDTVSTRRRTPSGDERRRRCADDAPATAIALASTTEPRRHGHQGARARMARGTRHEGHPHHGGCGCCLTTSRMPRRPRSRPPVRLCGRTHAMRLPRG